MGDVGLVAHADWSVDARKRWITVASRTSSGWLLSAPEPVGDVSTFLRRLLGRADGGAVALGMDLPIGLPRGYAIKRPEADFLAFFNKIQTLPDFFRVCSTVEDIRPDRPFYPMRGTVGMTRLSHALALGLPDAASLSRTCDKATAERPAGAPLFWTLGANQTGKAAIVAWQQVILPALTNHFPLRLWPFEGSFLGLLTPGYVTLAETYPAEALRHFGIKLRGSKRRQTDRIATSDALCLAMNQLAASPDKNLSQMIQLGFGSDSAGEDRFDSFIGVLCVLNILNRGRPDTAPDDTWIRRWEGWVLGQTLLPETMASGLRAASS